MDTCVLASNVTCGDSSSPRKSNSWNRALQFKALSPDNVGGEGWVRGERLATTVRFGNADRCPLTLSSLPQGKLGGERNSWNRALRARWSYCL